MAEYRMNLQLFAGEKTEPATPRRREEARKKGQVAKSGEVGTALMVLTGVLLLNALAPYIGRHLRETVQYFLENMAHWEGDFLGFQQMFLFGLAKLGLIVGPILLGFLAVGFSVRQCRLAFSHHLSPFCRSFPGSIPLKALRGSFPKGLWWSLPSQWLR